jgi:APA family basic amino acid/polyamine antiporter
VFARLHKRYRTPWFTIIFFSLIAIVLVIPGETDFLGNLYAFGAMLSFTIAHVSIVALRIRAPDHRRPYLAPWNVRMRGRLIPLGPVIGAAGTFAAWVSVVVLHGEARAVGIPWMVIGMIGYFAYRHSQGLDPWTEARLQHPSRPEDFHELTYRSALVPIFGTDVSAKTMRSAARLVGEGATVDAVYVLQVPAQLSLDAGMAEEEALGRSVLESARLQGRQSGLKVHTSLIRTRNPGAALVDEARARESDLIYLGTVHAPPSQRALGPTAAYLLAERPCRIVVETDRRVVGAGERPAAVPEPIV